MPLRSLTATALLALLAGGACHRATPSGNAPSAPRPTAIASARTAALPPLRIVSYNIRHGRGTDEQVNLARTGEVLRRLDADLIGLQEVDDRVRRSGGVPQADSLGAALGMHAAFGAFMPYQGGRYGLGLLSRFPITRTTALRLPDGNEPRVALAAEIVIPPFADTVVAIVVHFDWVEDDGFRYPQAQMVAAAVDSIRHPVILLGDFNDDPASRTLALFRARAQELPKPVEDHFTFSSTKPDQEIDYIFLRGSTRWVPLRAEVITEPLASDHRPLVGLIARTPRR
jgi:endonuclease/exonuclease/phosphatase family metal-dependent hydrolase